MSSFEAERLARIAANELRLQALCIPRLQSPPKATRKPRPVNNTTAAPGRRSERLQAVSRQHRRPTDESAAMSAFTNDIQPPLRETIRMIWAATGEEPLDEEDMQVLVDAKAKPSFLRSCGHEGSEHAFKKLKMCYSSFDDQLWHLA